MKKRYTVNQEGKANFEYTAEVQTGSGKKLVEIYAPSMDAAKTFLRNEIIYTFEMVDEGPTHY